MTRIDNPDGSVTIIGRVSTTTARDGTVLTRSAPTAAKSAAMTARRALT